MSEPEMINNVAGYPMNPDVRKKFEIEVNDWIREGILIKKQSHVGGILPLFPVVQLNKGKVRPVLNFKNVNESVTSHTGEAQECHASLRKWRMLGDNIAVVDLKRAYLQIHVSSESVETPNSEI